MKGYFFVESRDPFDSSDSEALLEFASGLSREGQHVTLFLVQNGVLAARSRSQAAAFSELLLAGVEVLADEFSLRERGISPKCLLPGIRAASLAVVAEELGEGRKMSVFAYPEATEPNLHKPYC